MESLGANVPEPFVVHCPVEFAPKTAPFRVTAELLLQTVSSKPASTCGPGVRMILIVSLTAAQPPFPVLVKIKVTFPLDVSAALGV